jgi:uncharacterized protein YjiS (DUF1127 family)
VSFVKAAPQQDIDPNKWLPMEMAMSALTSRFVTNFHVLDGLSRIAQTLEVWRERARSRHELAQWSERELHDIGVSAASVADEINKPFWRA